MVNIFKQKPFIFSFFVLAVLISLHLAGSYYSLYWRFSWYDVLVHITSGLWIGLLFLWLSAIFGQVNSLKEYKAKTFLIALVSAVLIGVIWELVENYAQLTSVRDGSYSFNTAMDILNDALGGILAYMYFVRRKKNIDNTADILHPFYNQTGLIKA